MADDPAPNRTPLLQRPDLTPKDRVRIGGAVAALLGAGLVAIVALGALAIWHLVRRGRLIRERLGNPRDVRLPEVDPRDLNRHAAHNASPCSPPTLPSPTRGEGEDPPSGSQSDPLPP